MRLIDADALHERIAQVRNRRKKAPDGIDDLFVRGLNFAEGMLFEAPTVDARLTVHSSWDYGETGPEPDENNNVQANCRNCGAGDTHATRMINKVPYCWKCGAKMEARTC